jgi:chromosomal replication initiation ATPase DnaA
MSGAGSHSHADTIALVRRNLAHERMLPLAERVARDACVPLDMLLGRRKVGVHVTRARHRLWWLLHGTFGLSLPELGRLVGREHTTCLVAVREREQEALAKLKAEGIAT